MHRSLKRDIHRIGGGAALLASGLSSQQRNLRIWCVATAAIPCARKFVACGDHGEICDNDQREADLMDQVVGPFLFMRDEVLNLLFKGAALHDHITN